MNNNRFFLFIGVLFLSFININAQRSAIYTHENKDLAQALELYNNKQYQAAQTLFSKVKSITDDQETEAQCAYHIANAAIRLNQLGADKLMQEFVDKYPTSTKRNAAFLEVADYYFKIGKYPYALKWYDRVKQQSLARAQHERFTFNKAYVHFLGKQYTKAAPLFQRVTNSEAYGAEAKYYLGYMAYLADSYEQASDYFEGISEKGEYDDKLSYFRADMNFKLGNFQGAIDEALSKLPNADRKEVSELNKIIGESYFNLEKYEEALPYLTEYRGKRGRWNNTDYYQLGYTHYKVGDFESAIGQFNKIVGGNDDVAQNAYYHLAECYLKLDQKQEALNAFRYASQMDHEPQIQEDAYLNYAKLSYEVGNPYRDVPSVIKGYLDTYPESSSKAEMQALLIDSLISSKNYEAALDLLQNDKDFENKEAFQKVAFLRGIELHNENDFQQANEFFERSLEEPVDANYTARATFWKAETDYLLNNFGEALASYQVFAYNPMARDTDEFKNIHYNIGYANFKLKDYAAAVPAFKQFIQNNSEEKEHINDAYLRLGDSHFVSSQYGQAIQAYDNAIALKGVDDDYAFFQKVLSEGLLGRANKKIEGLRTFIQTYPKSKLRDDALFELGNTYAIKNNEPEALDAYDQLIATYGMSSFTPKAILRQGLIHYNAGSNEDALLKFRKVVRAYPNTQEAIQAVATARLIYVDLGRVDEYAAWVRDLDFVDVTDAQLDNDAYTSADRQLQQGKTEAAIRGFEKYVVQFPKGLHALQANFYLAELYYGNNRKPQAVTHYQFVVQRSQNEFTEKALTRLSEILFTQREYNEAISVLRRLEDEGQVSQNVIYAQSNLMKAYYEIRDYENAVVYAEKVLASDRIDNRVKSDAQVIIARAALKTSDEEKAKNAYREVQRIATGRLAAEALYYDGYFKHKDGDFEASNESVQRLARDYSSYKEFGAKGLVVMAKNFYELNDAFQATYILENVIKNFGEFPQVVSEARSELARIKKEEAKTNSSIDTQN